MSVFLFFLLFFLGGGNKNVLSLTVLAAGLVTQVPMRFPIDSVKPGINKESHAKVIRKLE